MNKIKVIFGLAVLTVNFFGWYVIFEVITGTSWKSPKLRISGPSSAVVQKMKKQTASVSSDALNMRTGPSSEDPIVIVLYRGNIMNVLEKPNETKWAKVEYEGKIGYVHVDYIIIDEGGD
jgi:uncharacterized protein YraI